MAMQTTAPVSTDVSMYDEEEQFIAPKQFQAIKPTESKEMKLRRIIKEEYKTGGEHLAHEAIDTEIGRDNLLSMSQMPERQLVGGVGTGLDALAGFSKAASLIPSLTKNYIKNPKGQEVLKELLSRLSGMRTYYPYKSKDIAKSPKEIQKQKALMQAYYEALSQYTKRGSASVDAEKHLIDMLKR